MIQVDTKNILFICGGAFDGIDKLISRRLGSQTVGYTSLQDNDTIDKDNLLKYLTPVDVKAFGLIPELIGRLPVLTHLNPLDGKALRRILTEPKNSLMKQYIRLFEIDGVKLVIEDEVLDMIVNKAVEFKLGARGLRSICEAVMLDVMYETPSDKNTKLVKIDLEYAEKKLMGSILSKLRAA